MNLMAQFGLVLLAGAAVSGALGATGLIPNVAWTLALTLGLIGVIFLAVSPLLGLGPGAKAALLASGLPAIATIQDVRPTASRIGAQAVVVMTLSFDDANGSHHVVRHREAVLPWHGMRLRPGGQLLIRHHPDKPSRLAIDWDAESV